MPGYGHYKWMRARLTKNLLLIVLCGIVVAAMVFAFSLLVRRASSSSAGVLKPTPLPAATPTSKVIMDENALPGTDDWKIPRVKGASIQIEAYANATSALPGQALTFYVSTEKDGTTYSIAIYRLGWYQGHGGRLVISLPPQQGLAQGYFDEDGYRLVNCSSCSVDPLAGLVEANWIPSFTFIIPYNWITGVYLAKFTDSHGMQTYVPFDVKSTAHTAYVAVTSDTTYEAYNNWGGYSLYDYNSLNTNGLNRAVKVSFDRPYTDAFGASDVLLFEADAIHWLERQGYDLSYISAVDLHQNPAQLLQHRAYLSLGHDEYWTKEMRDGVENARSHGVSLAFLEANAAYWQIRLGPDSAGVQNRTVVCYKVETGHDDLAHDPIYGKDNTRVTTRWRDPLLGHPENALIGIMYSDYNNGLRGFPWQVSPAAKSPAFVGTGLQPGKSYGCGIVGYEWDRIFANGATPRGLQVLATSRTFTSDNSPDVSNTTYYIASSGAMVFAAGATYWTSALDEYRWSPDSNCAGQPLVIPGMQKLLANIMLALVSNHFQ